MATFNLGQNTKLSFLGTLLALLLVSGLPATDIAYFTNRVATTPDGTTNNHRIWVGTGEWADFTSNVGTIVWQVADYPAMTNLITSSGPSYSYQFPMLLNASSTDHNYPTVIQKIVTAKKSSTDTSGYAAVSWVFNVYPPDRNDYTIRSIWVYPTATQTAAYIGSGFTADVSIQPNNVSFSECKFHEDVCPDQNVSGYFVGKAHDHVPNPSWLSWPFTDDCGITTPGFQFNPSLRMVIIAGTWDWDIPQQYRVGGGPTFETYIHQLQSFSKADGNSMKTTKRSASYSRDALTGLPPGGGK